MWTRKSIKDIDDVSKNDLIKTITRLNSQLEIKEKSQ